MKKRSTTNIAAKKSLGQNWLVNPRAIERIVTTAEISKGDIVLEVGPGTGNLTQKLVAAGANVIGIEKDHRLIEILRPKFPSAKFIEGDVLKISASDLKLEPNCYKIVANLPYYITSHFIRDVFEKWPRPKLIVLTIQKEVAQRMSAKPPKMSLLSISVQFYSSPRIIGYLAPGNFTPPPKVDSAIISLDPKHITLDHDKKKNFFSLIKAGFSNKRKKLINNLKNGLGLNPNTLVKVFSILELSQNTRAEELSLEQWLSLSESLYL